MIESFVKKFTDEGIGEVVLLKNKYYFKNKQMNNISREPFAIGIPLGDTKKDFKPSVYLLEILSKKTKNKVFINEKAEWLFLCGRDVFTKSVVKDESTEDVFLVQNEKDENLGLGKKTRTGMIKNIIDRGDFLRRERR